MGAIKDGPQTIPRWSAYHTCKCYIKTPCRSYHLIYLFKIAHWTAALRMARMQCQLQLREFYTPLLHTGPGRKTLHTSMVGTSPPKRETLANFCLQWTMSLTKWKYCSYPHNRRSRWLHSGVSWLVNSQWKSSKTRIQPMTMCYVWLICTPL